MVDDKVTTAAKATRKAAAAALDRDEKILAAVMAGHSLRTVAAVCGLSHQRVHQIVHAKSNLGARPA